MMKRMTGLGEGMSVKWSPNPHSDRHGEVKGGVIHVYDPDEEGAVETLKHELIEHHISEEIVEPLVEYLNAQKRLIEALIYRRKEELVDRLAKLL